MMKTYAVPALRTHSDTEIRVPGSKSHANRAIICACLAKGTTVIRNSTPCDDVLVMVESLKRMGFDVRWINEEKGELEVKGGIPAKGGRAILDCHNAGTAIRFLTSLAAIIPGEWTLTGDLHMKKRPIRDLVSALRSLGAEISDTDGCPPVTVKGGTLKGGSAILDASVSSQFLTSLLLVAPMLKEGLTIGLSGTLASSGYIDLTKKVMKDFGVELKQKGKEFTVVQNNYSAVPSYEIEGDWSAAGAWIVLEALTGSKVRMPNLKKDSSQADRKLPEYIGKLKKAGNISFDASEIPDQVMNLAVLAAFRKGSVTMTGIANLRKKECDRLHVITTELKKAGMKILEHPDGISVSPARAPSPSHAYSSLPQVVLDPHGDHRMVMAFAILGLVRGDITIQDPDCVWKSYPTFFEDLEKILSSTRPITVVGMRGVGKSSLGRRLAARLGLTHLDSDHLIEDVHGNIRVNVEKHGWDDFRKKEEEVIASALRPGIVFSLGGGALISGKTRKLVKERSTVVWLQAKETELIKRLATKKRPSVTDLPLEEEVRRLLVERGPQYREVADIEISPTVRFGEQVPIVIKELTRLLRTR